MSITVLFFPKKIAFYLTHFFLQLFLLTDLCLLYLFSGQFIQFCLTYFDIPVNFPVKSFVNCSHKSFLFSLGLCWRSSHIMNGRLLLRNVPVLP